MSRRPDPAARARAIFLGLPDTEETPTWGKPHFRVAGKIFGGLGEEPSGKTSIGFKLEMDHADALVASDPRFTRAAYVGHKGWVSMDVSAVVQWDEVRTLVHESYRLIAPKRSLAKLGEADAPTAAGAPAPAKKKSAARTSRGTTKVAAPRKRAAAALKAKQAAPKKAAPKPRGSTPAARRAPR